MITSAMKIIPPEFGVNETFLPVLLLSAVRGGEAPQWKLQLLPNVDSVIVLGPVSGSFS